jgi:hypothetical protein
MTITEAFKKYTDAGFACLPTKEDKLPMTADTWVREFSDGEFSSAYGIGVACGKRSGGLECIDFDNHSGEADVSIKQFMTIPEVKSIYDRYKLPIEKTQGGGYHLIYRCDTVDGNQKLARRWKVDAKPKPRPDSFIETRGEGGYFCIDPTPGYSFKRGNFLETPKISVIERAVLLGSARSFNEYCEVKKVEYEKDGDRPGDIYNNSTGSISDTKTLLQNEGWAEVRSGMWRRPGKTEGCSATFGKVAPNILYVFSDNAHPFEAGNAYTPFQVLGLLKFNGDFSEAAKSLPRQERLMSQVQKGRIDISELEKILHKATIDTSKHISRPPTILSIREQNGTSYVYKRIFSLGNFSSIIGKAKSRKTFLVILFTAAMMRTKDDGGKIFGEMPPEKKLILYFDTEQGEYDSYVAIKRIQKLAHGDMNLRAFNLRPYDPMERCQIIEYAFKLWGNEVGYCVIDGVADLATGINEEDEATRVVTMLLRLTKEYNCHISTVIHQNKNDYNATGHLGSSVTKKSEIIIEVAKIQGDSSRSDVKCSMSRSIDFEPFVMKINDDGLPEVDDNPPIHQPSFMDNKNEDAPF